MDDLMQLLGCRIDAYGGRFAQAHRKILDLHKIQTRTDWNGAIEYGCACTHSCEYGGDPIWNNNIECEEVLALAEAYDLTPADER